jgi:hypothetical protein
MIRPKISRIDFDLIEIERFEVFAGQGVPVVDFHTGAALLRATLSSSASHGLVGGLLCVVSLAVAGLYAYFRFVRKLKSFELPGALSDAAL